MLIAREAAETLLEEHVKNDYQRLHARMVAVALEKYAEKFNEDKDLWYITGLLHDLDYDKHPNEHPRMSLEWFKEWNYPEELIHAVEAHGFLQPRTEPNSKLAAALIACDEMCGIIYAYFLMRPEGLKDMQAKSVKKKFKDKAFAAKIDRSEVEYGMQKLGVEFNEHVETILDALQEANILSK